MAEKNYIDKKAARVSLKKVDQYIEQVKAARKQLISDVESMYKNNVWFGGKKASNWYKNLDENLVGVQNKIIVNKKGSVQYNNTLILQKITSISKLAD